MFSSLRARESASSVVDLDEIGSQHARLFEVSGRRAAARGGIQEAHVDVDAHGERESRSWALGVRVRRAQRCGEI